MSESKGPAAPVEVRFDAELALPELFARHLAQHPDKPAMIEEGVSRSWQETIERSYRMANGLIALGIGPGDKVAMLSRNSMAYSELFAAALLCGACAVPMQSMITEETLDLMLKDSGAKAIFVGGIGQRHYSRRFWKRQIVRRIRRRSVCFS